MIKKITLVMMSLVFAACASSTVLKSNDKDAKIYVNGEYVGTGSATYSDTKIMGSSNLVTLKKDGCEDQVHSFSRNEEFDAGACAGGVFVLIPFLWVMKYKPVHNYDFNCQK